MHGLALPFIFGAPSEELPGLTATAIREWALRHGVRTVLTAHTPVGQGRTVLEKVTAELAGEGISLVRVRRAWDSAAWPEAKRGFFAFREKAAELIA